jgi:TfoX/Sxy family transcriptional regulator of competence genes
VEWEKASTELGDLLRQAAEPFAHVETRKMFGGLTLFFNGHMFSGVHGRKIIMRLGEEDRAVTESQSGAVPFEPMPGRVMREYVVVPERVWSKPEVLEDWLHRSIEYVGALPPKEPKPKKARTAKDPQVM